MFGEAGRSKGRAMTWTKTLVHKFNIGKDADANADADTDAVVSSIPLLNFTEVR